MEIAKTAAKEKALAALQVSRPPMSNTLENMGVFKGSLGHQTPIPRSTGRKLPQVPPISKTNEDASVEKHDRSERRHEPE